MRVFLCTANNYLLFFVPRMYSVLNEVLKRSVKKWLLPLKMWMYRFILLFIHSFIEKFFLGIPRPAGTNWLVCRLCSAPNPALLPTADLTDQQGASLQAHRQIFSRHSSISFPYSVPSRCLGMPGFSG